MINKYNQKWSNFIASFHLRNSNNDIYELRTLITAQNKFPQIFNRISKFYNSTIINLSIFNNFPQ